MTLLNIMTETGMFDSKGKFEGFQQGAIKLTRERKENCEEPRASLSEKS